jgi:hypothetical protein
MKKKTLIGWASKDWNLYWQFWATSGNSRVYLLEHSAIGKEKKKEYGTKVRVTIEEV